MDVFICFENMNVMNDMMTRYNEGFSSEEDKIMFSSICVGKRSECVLEQEYALHFIQFCLENSNESFIVGSIPQFYDWNGPFGRFIRPKS